MTNLLWFLGTSALALCVSIIATSSAASELTVFEVLNTSTSHSVLVQLLIVTELSLYLNNGTLSSTLFAPNDTAITMLLQPPQLYYFESEFWSLHLFAILSYHIVPEILDESQIFALTQLPTLAQGVDIPVNKVNKTLDGGASIITADITASNGFIQIPNRVLLPDVLNLTVADMFFNNATNGSSAGGTFATNYTLFKKIFAIAQTSNDLSQAFLSSNSQNGLTLFAPPDSAFADVATTTIDLLLNKTTLAYVFVLNHITNINVYALPAPPRPLGFYMASGLSAWFSAADQYQSRVNTANITDSILVGNGVINIIDQVLLPPLIGYLLSITTSVGAFNFSTFLDIVQGPANASSFLHAGSLYTLFAPLNSAFALLPQNLLSRLDQPVWNRHLRSLVFQHFTEGSLQSNAFLEGNPTSLAMLSGFNTTVQADSDGNVTIDNARSEIADLVAFDGVIFGIDRVLLPPSVVDPIFYRLEQMGGFSTLLSLISSTNMTNLLNNTQGPITLLAPNDAAFEAVGNLSKYSTPTIQTILMGHVFAGNIFLNDLLSSSVSKKWNVSRTGSKIYVNDASILTEDMLASNGVIQVLNAVLISPSEIATPPPTPVPVISPSPSPVAIPASNKATSDAHHGFTQQYAVFACGVSLFWAWFYLPIF